MSDEHERDLAIWKEGEREELERSDATGYAGDWPDPDALRAQQHADMFAERAHRLALLDIVTQCVVRHGSDEAIDAAEELFRYLKDEP